MALISNTLFEAWKLLLESAPYVLFGLIVSGLLRVSLSPGSVAAHLGKGRFLSVFKAALLGIPIPLCSCGVLPAAASLKKQGANSGATTAFLISTPESGADSIAVTYALMDPIMTLARPTTAFATAVAAGLAENLLNTKEDRVVPDPDLSCPVDACCDGKDCRPDRHRHHHTFGEKVTAGLRYALGEVWQDMAGWFLVGLLLAGLITAFVPQEMFNRYMGSGPGAMLIMLAMSIPLYICATASTPIAAALILKGVSPGAALVFLLAGPATNITSLTVLLGILGKRATAIYLVFIAVFAILAGLALDRLYLFLGVSPRALVGQAAQAVPAWAEWTSALFLLSLSAKPVFKGLSAGIHRISSWAGLNRRTPSHGDASNPGPCTGST